MVKKIIRKKKKLKTVSARRPARKTARVAPLKRKTVIEKEKKEIIGSQEMMVEGSKFYTPPTPKIMRQIPQDLPAGYGENKIVLQVRDPWWLHSYWEVTADKWDSLKGKLGEAFYTAKVSKCNE